MKLFAIGFVEPLAVHSLFLNYLFSKCSCAIYPYINPPTHTHTHTHTHTQTSTVTKRVSSIHVLDMPGFQHRELAGEYLYVYINMCLCIQVYVCVFGLWVLYIQYKFSFQVT